MPFGRPYDEPNDRARLVALTDRVRRAGGMWADRDIPGAAASLDYFAGRDILECKSTSSRSRTADGLPRDWEAQVRWQMGCSGRRRAVVAALPLAHARQLRTTARHGGVARPSRALR